MSQDRRKFLGTLVAAGVAPMVARPELLAAELAAGQGGPQFDVSWTSKVTGKHRAVFDSVEIDWGLGLIRSLIWKKDYGDVYGVAPADMSSVVVLRHNAIYLIMSNEFWARHELGKVTGITDPATKAPIARNPVVGANPFGLPAALADDSLKKAMAAGTVLACNLAFQLDVVARVKADLKLDDAKAYETARKDVIPGVLLQPSGVFATLRAQEAGCQYIQATAA